MSMPTLTCDIGGAVSAVMSVVQNGMTIAKDMAASGAVTVNYDKISNSQGGTRPEQIEVKFKAKNQATVDGKTYQQDDEVTVRPEVAQVLYIPSGAEFSLSKKVRFVLGVRHYTAHVIRAAVALKMDVALRKLNMQIVNRNKIKAELDDKYLATDWDVIDDTDDIYSTYYLPTSGSTPSVPVVSGDKPIWGIKTLTLSLLPKSECTNKKGTRQYNNNPYRAYGDGNDGKIDFLFAYDGDGDSTKAKVSATHDFSAALAWIKSYPNSRDTQDVLELDLVGDQPNITDMKPGKNWVVE